MPADAILIFDEDEPKSTTNIDDAPTVIPENWKAMQEMTGAWMEGLVITCSAGGLLLPLLLIGIMESL
jgi:hypothetical protein